MAAVVYTIDEKEFKELKEEEEEEKKEKVDPISSHLFLSSVGDLECPICYAVVSRDPPEMPCGHVVCGECFAKLVIERVPIMNLPRDQMPIHSTRSRELPKKRCPTCREYVDIDLPVSKLTRGRIERLELKCPNRGCKCTYILGKDNYTNRQKHLVVCLFESVNCSYGCSIEVKRKDIKIHEQECPLRPIPCPSCQEQFNTFDLQLHIDEALNGLGCPNMRVCPLECKDEKGTQIIITAAEENEHVSSFCNERLVVCFFCEIISEKSLSSSSSSSSTTTTTTTTMAPINSSVCSISSLSGPKVINYMYKQSELEYHNISYMHHHMTAMAQELLAQRKASQLQGELIANLQRSLNARSFSASVSASSSSASNYASSIHSVSTSENSTINSQRSRYSNSNSNSNLNSSPFPPVRFWRTNASTTPSRHISRNV